mmetsp:Transcript_36728/g.37149  ORF Transcript_36728/g.37149 Transcript_36728/m.37149 type:complete len:116 (-) Transcript_36728:202-549(-)
MTVLLTVEGVFYQSTYSGVNENSVKDTKQIYPMGTPSSAYGENVDPLKVVLSSSDGIGWGILRQEEEEQQQQQGDGDGDDTNSTLANHFRYRIGMAAKKKEFKILSTLLKPKPKQ